MSATGIWTEDAAVAWSAEAPSAVLPRSRARARARGFTLLELLVVLLIAGLLTGVAVVRLPSFVKLDGGQLEVLRGQFRHAADYSVLTGHAVALELGGPGYVFKERVPDGWRTLDEPALTPRAGGPGERLLFRVDGRPVRADPDAPARVAFVDGYGDWPPIEATLIRPGEAARTMALSTPGRR